MNKEIQEKPKAVFTKKGILKFLLVYGVFFILVFIFDDGIPKERIEREKKDSNNIKVIAFDKYNNEYLVITYNNLDNYKNNSNLIFNLPKVSNIVYISKHDYYSYFLKKTNNNSNLYRVESSNPFNFITEYSVNENNEIIIKLTDLVYSENKILTFIFIPLILIWFSFLIYSALLSIKNLIINKNKENYLENFLIVLTVLVYFSIFGGLFYLYLQYFEKTGLKNIETSENYTGKTYYITLNIISKKLECISGKNIDVVLKDKNYSFDFSDISGNVVTNNLNCQFKMIPQQNEYKTFTVENIENNIHTITEYKLFKDKTIKPIFVQYLNYNIYYLQIILFSVIVLIITVIFLVKYFMKKDKQKKFLSKETDLL